jgi:hypothetical protein
LTLIRHLQVEVYYKGDIPSNPIIILNNVPSITITPNIKTLPQTPKRPEKSPQLRTYIGIVV